MNFLEYDFYVDVGLITSPKWGLESIEIVGIAPIVSGVVVGLFFVIAAGLGSEEVAGDD
jgi:multicomponent Na+:H+ antiporter subunit B